jgi:hypothetical protein
MTINSKFVDKNNLHTQIILELVAETNVCYVALYKIFFGISFKILSLSFDTLEKAENFYEMFIEGMNSTHYEPID